MNMQIRMDLIETCKRLQLERINLFLGRSVFLRTCFDLLCALATATVAATLVYALCTAGGANANLLGWATISTWFGTFLCVHIYREVFI